MRNDKIGGFDKYDVEDSVRTLIRAEEIKNNDEKFYAVVLKEVEKTAKAAAEAAAQKQVAAAEVKLRGRVGKKLKEIYGKGSSHKSGGH